jgi:Effector-associated domain 1
VKLAGAIRKQIREALNQAFDYRTLDEAMRDVDIPFQDIASDGPGFTTAIAALIDWAEHHEAIDAMLDGAVEGNKDSEVLRKARDAYQHWLIAPIPQAASPGGMTPMWAAPRSGPAGRKQADTTGPLTPPAPPQPQGPIKPLDDPARSEWEIAWTEVWGERWRTMLDEMRDQLWRRVAGIMPAPPPGATGGTSGSGRNGAEAASRIQAQGSGQSRVANLSGSPTARPTSDQPIDTGRED